MDTNPSQNPSQDCGQDRGAGVSAAELEDGLFDGVREHLESMIAWGRGEQALGLEHASLEERVLADGNEAMRRSCPSVARFGW